MNLNENTQNFMIKSIYYDWKLIYYDFHLFFFLINITYIKPHLHIKGYMKCKKYTVLNRLLKTGNTKLIHLASIWGFIRDN